MTSRELADLTYAVGIPTGIALVVALVVLVAWKGPRWWLALGKLALRSASAVGKASGTAMAAPLAAIARDTAEVRREQKAHHNDVAGRLTAIEVTGYGTHENTLKILARLGDEDAAERLKLIAQPARRSKWVPAAPTPPPGDSEPNGRQ